MRSTCRNAISKLLKCRDHAFSSIDSLGDLPAFHVDLRHRLEDGCLLASVLDVLTNCPGVFCRSEGVLKVSRQKMRVDSCCEHCGLLVPVFELAIDGLRVVQRLGR